MNAKHFDVVKSISKRFKLIYVMILEFGLNGTSYYRGKGYHFISGGPVEIETHGTGFAITIPGTPMNLHSLQN